MLVSKSLIVYNEVGMSFMKKKVLFISSTGGHLSEMLQLKELFKKYDYHIITEKTKNNMSLLQMHPNKVNFLVYGKYIIFIILIKK